MKKLLLLIAIACVLFSGCKKSDPVKPPLSHLAQLQSNILGNWYYTALTLGYYVNGTTDVYDEIATATYLRNEPYFIFNKDFSGSYVDAYNNQTAPFTYTITSVNGADSLICVGGFSSRLGIKLIDNTQLGISQSIHDDEKVLDVFGHVQLTDMTKLTATLLHVPVK
jgi:hypothetical protein